jgi:threonine/homoserine/homoserine lactone efflux protein
MGAENIGVFIAAGLILNITPGADMLFIAGKSASQGTKAGIVAALGIGTGCLIHIVCAAFGLSVVLAASATAFTIVKFAGAAYLIYLGISTLFNVRSRAVTTGAGESTPVPLRGIFRQAILVNALNPKVALFFMAFLPQFVSETAAHPSLSFLFLGTLFDVNGTIVNVLFALMTSHIASRFRGSEVLAPALKIVAASLFVGLGVKLAMTTQK